MDLKSFIFHFFSAIPDFKSFWRRDTNSVVIFKINFKIFKLVLACKAFFFNLKQKVHYFFLFLPDVIIPSAIVIVKFVVHLRVAHHLDFIFKFKIYLKKWQILILME